VDVDRFLAFAAERSCGALGLRRCAVYVDDGDGRLACRAAYHSGAFSRAPTDIDADATDDLQRLADVGIARWLVHASEETSPAVRRFLDEWNTRTLLLVPLLGEANLTGMMFLADDGGIRSQFATELEVAASLGLVIGRLVAHRREQAAVGATLQARLLEGAARIDRRLSQAVLEGGGLAGIIALVAELIGKPVALCDARRRLVAASQPGQMSPLDGEVVEVVLRDADLADILKTTEFGGCRVLAPRLYDGVSLRHLLSPVDLCGERCGWIIAKEQPSRFTTLDGLVIRQAASHVALELSAQRRALAAAIDVRAWLARQLLRGTPDLRGEAEHIGIDLDVPRIVAFVTRSSGALSSIEAALLVDSIRACVRGEVLWTRGSEGVALLIEVDQESAVVAEVRAIKQILRDALDEIGDGVAGLSGVCREPTGTPRAYREAREVAQGLMRFATADGPHVMASEDLGPGRVFLANGEVAAIGLFVEDVLGPLLTGGEAMTQLLTTLETYFAARRSIRRTSSALGVHENTVRYRLGRVHVLTGLDVGGRPDDQMSIHLALLVMRLRGHEALRGFEDDSP
jgi:sugar diacid utilization regulator